MADSVAVTRLDRYGRCPFRLNAPTGCGAAVYALARACPMSCGPGPAGALLRLPYSRRR